MGNVHEIRDPRAAATLLQVALSTLGRCERRDEIMGHVSDIIAADRLQAELHGLFVESGADYPTDTNEALWNQAQGIRDRARAALPGAIGLTEADIDLLRVVL